MQEQFYRFSNLRILFHLYPNILFKQNEYKGFSRKKVPILTAELP